MAKDLNDSGEKDYLDFLNFLILIASSPALFCFLDTGKITDVKAIPLRSAKLNWPFFPIPLGASQ